MNINSLQSKFTDLQEWVEVFDVLSVQETKVDKSFPNSQYALKGYKMYRQDRKAVGVFCYIFAGKFSSYQIKVKCNEIEAILINIQTGPQKFSLLTVYKPPSVKNEVFMQELSALSDIAISNNPNVICLGDMNCDLLHLCDNAKQERALLDICDVYDLHCLINEQKGISLTKEFCIDVILTNTPALVLESGTLEPGLSDHLLIYTVLNIKSKKPKTTFRISRSFKEFNADLFNMDL